ncbi:MAG: hypothetical protein ACR5K7_00570 [Symbiopectobacterium sp.]
MRELVISQDGTALYAGMNGVQCWCLVVMPSPMPLTFVSALTGSCTNHIAISADRLSFYSVQRHRVGDGHPLPAWIQFNVCSGQLRITDSDAV